MGKNPYPALAFGNAGASECSSLLEFSEATRTAFPSLRDYSADLPTRFSTRTTAAQINRLTLFAAVLPEIETTAVVDGSNQHTFVFHGHGVCDFQIEQKHYYARAGASSVLIPRDYPWTVKTFNPSTVTVSVDASHLRSTAEAMLGPDIRLASEASFSNPAELPLQLGQVSFHNLFQQGFSQIDHYGGIQSVVNASGIDEMFYRTLVLCTMPDRFIRESETREAAINHRQLRRVCEYVAAKLSNPITLTDLERFSHMSRRALHNAFKKTFGMSPMAWVREQRLLKARAFLTRPDERATVTQVLYRSGFTDASLFSTYYLRRFGEHPSSTLARSRFRG